MGIWHYRTVPHRFLYKSADANVTLVNVFCCTRNQCVECALGVMGAVVWGVRLRLCFFGVRETRNGGAMEIAGICRRRFYMCENGERKRKKADENTGLAEFRQISSRSA